MSKKIFEHFDQAISICENELLRIKAEKEKEKNDNKEKDKDKENGSSLVDKKSSDKNKVELNELKFSFFNFAKENLAQALDKILDLV